uniref:Cadherin domain-containing protein n=1 Tax=Paramormyrops kingsleyae TaxID=1676925 RepID=A0A3B3TEX3_9TELE
MRSCISSCSVCCVSTNLGLSFNACDLHLKHARLTLLQVEIHVLDENDNAPVFSQSKYHALLWENAALLTSVCQVYATDSDLGSNGQVVYEINRRQSDPSELFVIDSATGLIRVNNPLDYESQPYHELIVRARDNGIQPEYSSTLVAVTVLNINDNRPTINIMFLSESGAEEVSEGASMGHYVARISVYDPDLGEVNSVRASLEGGDGKFTLKQSDEFVFSLCVNGELDREKSDLYELTIVASDFGAPTLFSERTFLLKVSDENDSPPVFEKHLYIVNISEDAFPGSRLLHVRAGDLDEGVNSVVRYSMIKPDQGFPFHIDSESGLITTETPLDHEYHFTVLATKWNECAPQQASATVIITVLDENDNAPVFTHNAYFYTLQERPSPQGLMGAVRATDKDSGKNSQLSYFLLSDAKHFQINPNTGLLHLARSLDYELANVHAIVMKGAIPRSSHAKLQVLVLDENDNSPVFSQETYHVSVSEGAPVGSEILQVIATDNDQGSNGEVMFSLLEDTLAVFSIDESMGILRTAQLLNREAQGQYTFHVTATDGCSQGPRSSIATVTVDIEDVNDNAPAFAENPIVCLVSKDTAVNQTVVTMRAGDSDLGNNGTVIFDLSESDKFFSIDRNTGEIQLKASLSPGIFVTRLLHVIASDRGTPSLSSSSLVRIHLEEEPKLRFTEDSYMTAIPENSKTAGKSAKCGGIWPSRTRTEPYCGVRASSPYPSSVKPMPFSRFLFLFFKYP